MRELHGKWHRMKDFLPPLGAEVIVSETGHLGMHAFMGRLQVISGGCAYFFPYQSYDRNRLVEVNFKDAQWCRAGAEVDGP